MEFLLLIGSMIVSLVASGWATSILWLWFVVPTFSLSPITTLQAVGLAIVFRAFHGFDMSDKSRVTTGEVVMLTFKQVFMYIFVVVIAWFVTLFMQTVIKLQFYCKLTLDNEEEIV